MAMSYMGDSCLLIRTGGEHRLSHFLFRQAAYTELYSSALHWPYLGEDVLDKTIAAFQKPERRFGRTGAQDLTSTKVN